MAERFEEKYDLHPKKKELSFKKFVVKIYPENIDFFENLSSEERNNIINDAIANYNKEIETENEVRRDFHKFRNLSIFILLMIIAIPLFMYLIHLSWQSTQSSYKEMQGNFQKLYHSRNRY